MKMTKEQYNAYISAKGSQSPLLKNCAMAFLTGGAICTLGQWLRNLYGAAGLDDAAVAASTSITLIFFSALLTGLGIYDKIARHAGAGTIVPITGFANSIVSPAMEFKSEGFITGMAAKMFVVSGPVLVFGTVSSVVYGLILFLFGLV